MKVRIGKIVYDETCVRKATGFVVPSQEHPSINAAKRSMHKIRPARSFAGFKDLGPNAYDVLWELVGSPDRDQRVPHTETSL
jgi:hypothetical protein